STSTPALLDLVGVPFPGAPVFDHLDLAAGTFPAAGSGQVVLSATTARDWRVGIGATLADRQAPAVSSIRTLRVVGLLTSSLAQSNSAGAGYVDISTAQALLGGARTVSEVDADLTSGESAQAWVAAHKSDFGSGVVVTANQVDLGPIKSFQRLTSAPMTGAAAGALFIALFLVYLTLYTRMLERVRLYGTLYSIGSQRAQVRRLVLMEAIALGVMGSVLGTGLGVGVAAVLVQITPGLVGAAHIDLVLSRGPLLLGAVAGLGVSILASLLPAWRASQLSPVECLRSDHQPEARRRGLIRVLGAVCFAAGVLLTPIAARSTLLPYLSIGLVLLGAVMVVPDVLAPVASVIGRFTTRLEGATGRAAVMHLTKERSRSAYTLALVMIVAAMTVSTAAAIRTVRQTAQTQLLHNYAPDIRVFAGGGGFDAQALTTIKAIPGVSRTSLVGLGAYGSFLPAFPQGKAQFVFIDPASYFAVEGLPLTAGTQPEVQAALERGGAVVLPTWIATGGHLHVGQSIAVHTPRGTTSLRLVGTYENIIYTPAVVMSATDGSRLFGSAPANEIDVMASPGTPTAELRDAIVQRLAARGMAVSSQTVQELAATVGHNVDAVANTTYAVVGVGALIGLLGLANTLTMSILTRYREVGLLLALGSTKRRIRRMVVVESATLLGVGLLLSLPLGAVLAQLMVDAASSVVGGHAHLSYPWLVLPVVVAVAVLGGLAAAVLPARRAARFQPAFALRID
ncbi:MAG TPA: FtsX-like permease family protein, partial [Acidimicrobiales bacterium]|nr:FtsX-like permease family protein [Acidimicrobiales bacterium]